MDELPADPAIVAPAGPVVGDAVAYPIEPAELSNVDMDERAGAVTLVASRPLE